MDRVGLLALARYNAYATHLVLERAAHLPEGDWARPAGPSHGSVEQTVRHLLETEAFFVALCAGRAFVEFPGPLSLAELRGLAERVAAETEHFLTTAADADLAQPTALSLRGQTLRLPAWQLLTQIFLHATHHRGELSILMSQLGLPLPTLDILLHFIEASGQTWPSRA